MALQDGMALAGMGVPDAYAGVKTAGSYAFAVKGDGIDLAKMPGKGLETLASRDAPDSGRGIVASGDNQVAVDLETPYTCLMADEDVLAYSRS